MIVNTLGLGSDKFSGLFGEDVHEVDGPATNIKETNLAATNPAAVEVERVLSVAGETGTPVSSGCILANLRAGVC